MVSTCHTSAQEVQRTHLWIRPCKGNVFKAKKQIKFKKKYNLRLKINLKASFFCQTGAFYKQMLAL
jgi:hypothetical protein